MDKDEERRSALEKAKKIREQGQLAMRSLAAGQRSDGLILDLLTYTDQLQAANAKHVLGHLQQICEVCGHSKTEDGCAHCLKTSLVPWAVIEDYLNKLDTRDKTK